MNAMDKPLDGPASTGPAARRLSRQVELRWGSRVVRFGGDAPVMVQAMTNTDTADPVGGNPVTVAVLVMLPAFRSAWVVV